MEERTIDDAITLAINHVIEKGLDDLIRPPSFSLSPELEEIRRDPESFRQKATAETRRFVKAADLKNERIGSAHYFLYPKDEFGFRRVAWIDPFDLVKYLATCLLLFPAIENHRLPAERSIIHSHRRSADPQQIFDPNFSYRTFLNTSRTMSEQRVGKWKITTDISNFFDRIGNHLLENHLRDCACESSIIKLVTEILFHWTGDRRSFGVPVGSDASRILSEAALVSIDRELDSTGIEFIRYVDDYRIFADTRNAAIEAIRILSDLLAEQGLSLNLMKTNLIFLNEGVASDESEDHLEDGHSRIDESEKVAVTTRRLVSGRAKISKVYKEPGKEALLKLKKVDRDALVDDFLRSNGNRQEVLLRQAVKYFIYANQDVELIRILLRAKLSSIFYITDALTKEADRLGEDIKIKLRDLIFDETDAVNCSYPYQIALVRLFAHPGFERHEVIRRIVDTQRVADCPLFFREALLSGFAQLDRIRLRRLATNVFPASQALVRRAIYLAVKRHGALTEDERRPLLMTMERADGDFFIRKFR